jgi:hypothetical protein
MLFRNFWVATKGELGNPYQLPKISMVLHEFTSLMKQHLISKAIKPLDWIQMHPNVCTIILSWGQYTPTRVNDRNIRFSRQSHCPS